MNKLETMSFKIRTDLKEKLMKHKDKTGQSMSWVINKLLKEFLGVK